MISGYALGYSHALREKMIMQKSPRRKVSKQVSNLKADDLSANVDLRLAY